MQRKKYWNYEIQNEIDFWIIICTVYSLDEPEDSQKIVKVVTWTRKIKLFVLSQISSTYSHK